MTTLLVLQPSVGMTWPRSIARALGSTIGAVLAVLIGTFLHTPLALSLAVFPLIGLTMSLRKVNYVLFVTFLTPTFVLVADLAFPANELVYSVARLGNNLLGVMLALLATYLLWPKRDAEGLGAALDEAIQSNLKYLILSLQSENGLDERCEAARRKAGLASNKLEDMSRLALLERLRLAGSNRDVPVVAELLRRIAGTASQFRVSTDNCESALELTDWVKSTAERLRGIGNRTHSPKPARDRQPIVHSDIERSIVDQIARLSNAADLTGFNAAPKPGIENVAMSVNLNLPIQRCAKK